MPSTAVLGLPGSDRLLVSPRDAAKLRWITENLRAHCDTFAAPPAVGACQIGTGDPSGWPSAPAGWTGFRGTVADVSVRSGARSAEEIRGEHTMGRRSGDARS
jgi:hypothetical protein